MPLDTITMLPTSTTSGANACGDVQGPEKIDGQGAAHDVRVKPFIEMPALLTSRKMGPTRARPLGEGRNAGFARHVELSARHVRPPRLQRRCGLLGLLRVASREHDAKSPFRRADGKVSRRGLGCRQ